MNEDIRILDLVLWAQEHFYMIDITNTEICIWLSLQDSYRFKTLVAALAFIEGHRAALQSLGGK